MDSSVHVFLAALIAISAFGAGLYLKVIPNPVAALPPAPEVVHEDEALVLDEGSGKWERDKAEGKKDAPKPRKVDGLGEDPDYLGRDLDVQTPMLYFRGTKAARGESPARHRWSMAPESRKMLDLVDSEGTLVGAQKAGDLAKGELLAFEGQPGPTIIALGSNECIPCIKELGELVRDLAEPLQAHEARFLFVLMRLDGYGFMSFKLARERDQFFESYNETYRPVSASRVSIKDWMRFPQDSKKHWHSFTSEVLEVFEKGREVSLPVTLLLDGCGHIHQAIVGRLKTARLAHLKASAIALAKADCKAIEAP